MVAAASAALLLIVAAPAAAHAAPCPAGATSQPFAALGDNAFYALVPGSSFESGAPGWSLSEAEVVEEGQAEVQSEGERPRSDGQGDSPDHAGYLILEPHGVAVSPPVCVSSEDPTYRLYYRKRHGRDDATLNVALRWSDASGAHEVGGASLEGERDWALSPVLDLASRLPVTMPGSSVNVRFVFTCSGHSSWGIDDVYVDPYSR